MINLTDKQLRAYQRYIKARNRVGLVRTKDFNANSYVPHRDYTSTVDIVGMNHPLFELNEEWAEYKEASQMWWDIEPEFRKRERMSSIRGDYGIPDSWDEITSRVPDIFSVIKDESQ